MTCETAIQHDSGEGGMVERVLSEKQRSWLSHIEDCGKTGISMKAYAERHSLDLHQFYLWKGRLRKLGAVPGRPGPKQKLFKAVRVAARNGS